MALTLPAFTPIPANPYCVYYRPPDPDRMRRILVENGLWFTEEQAQWIREYLEIPTDYGDPLVALALCAVGYEKSFDDWTMWTPVYDTDGKLLLLEEVLGEDAKHLWRIRDAVYKLRDAVEWRCLKTLFLGNKIGPGQLPEPRYITLPILLTWARLHGIPISVQGAFKLAEVIQEGEPILPDVNPDKGTEDSAEDYKEGWAPEVGNRLRAALARFGLLEDMPPMPPAASPAAAAGGKEPTPATQEKKRRGRPSLSEKEIDLGKKICDFMKRGGKYKEAASTYKVSLKEVLLANSKRHYGPNYEFNEDELITEAKRLREAVRSRENRGAQIHTTKNVQNTMSNRM